MDIVEALNTLQPLVLREGDDCELDALSTIRAALAVVQNSSHNIASTKLLAQLHQMVLQSPLAAGYAISNLIKEVREQLRASGA
jgi:hypothetical protein